MIAGRFLDRRWLAPETIQTSSMDCGPAALKTLLEGYNIPVSYGRLREACQTDIDGTSIDAIEATADALGLSVEQCMVPPDHLRLRNAPEVPALVVTRQADGATHFVVLWREHRGWMQVMDPALGRRFLPARQFMAELLGHETSIPAADWREWAASPEFRGALKQRLRAIGIGPEASDSLCGEADQDPLWFGYGALDAAVRFVTRLVEAGGAAGGDEAGRLLNQLLRRTLENPEDIFGLIPAEFWSAVPDPESRALGEARLLMRGAVLLRVLGRKTPSTDGLSPEAPTSTELRAAVAEAPARPLRMLWSALREDGSFRPGLIVAALLVAVLGTLAEALLFRGLFDIGPQLALGEQRLAAAATLLGFLALILFFRLPLAAEGMRLGRQLDSRLRARLLANLPRLDDRYFRSRPVSDLADRAHSIHVMRAAPGLAMQLTQALFELALTLGGITLIARASTILALGVLASVLAVPLLFQPLLNERDLRMRGQAGALSRFYLDALVGIMPIRAHRAEEQVRREHESLLTEWGRASLSAMRAGLWAGGLQSLLTGIFAGWLLLDHFARSSGVTGADLLLVYWVMRLPAIGGQITSIAHQYPAQRNVFLRLMEPLQAPDAPEEGARPASTRPPASGVSVTIAGGLVVAGGHLILGDVDLSIRPGEHIAIVGLSGAGKSSLIGLMLGWHRLAEGSLAVDGAPLSEERLAHLRRETAWIDPAAQLWNASFLDNVMYAAPNENIGRVAEAVRGADLRQVLQRLPDGLQTLLGEGGGRLSGGEGQRLRLARGLAQSGVRLALLDEPFRGLDRGQRQSLLAEVRRHWKDATLLCVTHDLEETQSFPRVLVVHEGAIIEDGRPADLAAADTHYSRLIRAERIVQDTLWQGEHWTRIHVEQGRVQCMG